MNHLMRSYLCPFEISVRYLSTGIMCRLHFLLIVMVFSISFSQATVTVNTNVGSIEGFQEYITIDGEQKLISKFLGIPYAESTAGQNRFRKPQPKSPFKSPFDARKDPVACYQQAKEAMDFYRHIGVAGFSEDCLTLNIYVPNDLHSKDMLPVMVWIYGGGFSSGGASIYNPEVLALFGNVIVVTINYRIGMFGFLRDRNGIFPGNQGLWDQQLAIKWVHDNIDMFYGYKNEITIFGQSAGAGSVLLQAIYPGNNGLFRRVIAESGTALSPWALKNIPSFEGYFKEKGCYPDMGTFVSCLQSKDPITLLSNSTEFGPVVDGDFLIDTPEEIMNSKNDKTTHARNFFASLDIIVGVNNLDGAGFLDFFADTNGYSKQTFNVTRKDFSEQIVPSFVKFLSLKHEDTEKVIEKALTTFYIDWEKPDNYVYLRDGTKNMVNDGYLFSQAIQTVNSHSALQRGKTFFYEFAADVRKNIIPLVPWLSGSNHGDELPYVLGLPLLRNYSFYGMNFTSTPEEEQISRAVMAFWSNFAKSGNPNVPMNVIPFANTTWPEYTITSQRYFEVSNQMSPSSARENFHPMRMAFWIDVIPLISEKEVCQKTQPDITHFDPANLVG